MTHPSSGNGRGHRGRLHLHTGLTRTCWLVLASFALTTPFFPASAFAELIWQELWTDDFDHSINEEWQLQAFGNGDMIDVVKEGYVCTDRGLPPAEETVACEPPNNVLYGYAPARSVGHGYAARTPSFPALGIDESVQAYRIEFRYKVLDSDFCWTLPLASPDLMMVITDCSLDGSSARLGIVDAQFRGFRPIASLQVGVWNRFTIQVRRLTRPTEREVSIFLNDVLVERHHTSQRTPYDGIVFMDLPAMPVDTSDPAGLPDPAPSYFGSGYWDDVRLSALRRVDRPDGQKLRDVRFEPNPFNPATTLRFELEMPAVLDVVVFDVRGRQVRSLHSGLHAAGPVELRWDGRDARGHEASSGVYLVRVATPDESRVVRAVLVR